MITIEQIDPELLKKVEQEAKSAKRKQVARNAFGMLVTLNVQNIASTLNKIRSKSRSDRVYKDAWGVVNKLWQKYDGQPAVLESYITAGYKRNPIIIKSFNTDNIGKSSADGNDEDQGTLSKVSGFLQDGLNLFLAVKDTMKTLPENKEVPPPPKPEVKIIGMKPLVFGVVVVGALLTIGVITAVIIKSQKS